MALVSWVDDFAFVFAYAKTDFIMTRVISLQACQFFQQPIIGKRQAGRHLKCLSCCNDTALCNQDSDCEDSVTGKFRLKSN